MIWKLLVAVAIGWLGWRMWHGWGRPLPGTPKTWTLGFLRNEADVPGMRRAGSLAWGGLANCYYWADPASGVAGMLCGQFLPFADPGMLATFEAFERAVYAE